MISQLWFHRLRNCFITVAECDLLLTLSLTKRLVNHTRPSDGLYRRFPCDLPDRPRLP